MRDLAKESEQLLESFAFLKETRREKLAPFYGLRTAFLFMLGAGLLIYVGVLIAGK